MDPGIIGAAGSAVVGGLIWKLVEKGILTKQDALDIYTPIIQAKEGKARLAGIALGDSDSPEFEIQDALVSMVQALQKRFPD